MTIVITGAIEKVFGYDAPPAGQRDGVKVGSALCPLCRRLADIEVAHIGGKGTIRRLVCDFCGYWEWRIKGGEDASRTTTKPRRFREGIGSNKDSNKTTLLPISRSGRP